MTDADRICAPIKAGEELVKHYKRSCRIAELQGREFDARTDDAMGLLMDAIKNVVETFPSTQAGLLAKIAFLRKCNEEYPSVVGEMDILPTLHIAA